MAHMEMLDAGRKLEVRTGEIVLTVTETPVGSLVVEAVPVDGFELRTEAEAQGQTWRTRLHCERPITPRSDEDVLSELPF